MTISPRYPAPRLTAASAPSATLILRSPDALIAALPYLLGFMPRESAVLVWLRRGGILLTQRIDLPGPADDIGPWLDAVWGHAAAPKADEMIIVMVTGREAVSDITRIILETAHARGLLVRDALRFDGARWWSCLCEDDSCCGPEGRAVDETIRSAVAAEFAFTGRAPLADRESLVHGMSADEVGVDTVVDIVASIVEERTGLARRALERWRDLSIDGILEALASSHAGVGDPGEVSPRGDAETERIAALIAGLGDVRVRDTVLWECARLDPDVQLAALEVLLIALRCAPEGSVAPVATCCGLVSWLTGDGARASVAVERALRDDPSYSLALLLAQSLAAGLPPEAWRSATAELSRRECRHGSPSERSPRRRAS